MSMFTPTTCQSCVEKHGKIVSIVILGGADEVNINAHPFGRCVYVAMRTKKVGTATDEGEYGADAYLFYLNRLPDYYVNKSTAYAYGWKKNHNNLNDVLPGKMIGGDVFYNSAEKLPDKEGRIWYEADINYTGGKRNKQRILYSNDGLIFVTRDHYKTFYEIVR